MDNTTTLATISAAIALVVISATILSKASQIASVGSETLRALAISVNQLTGLVSQLRQEIHLMRPAQPRKRRAPAKTTTASHTE